MELLTKHTRFRAYQLKSKGASCSYFNGSQFTLLEARYNDDNKASVLHELKTCGGRSTIDVLHVTSWDSDHCIASELEAILNEFQPKRIEYPGYNIDQSIDNQVACLKLLHDYENESLKQGISRNVNRIDQPYVNGLDTATSWGYSNVIYNNRKDYPEANNNSTIKLFRSGSFSVLSVGDLEKEELSSWLVKFEMIRTEVDVLLLAHHGADNGFTTSAFLNAVKPSVAVALCNWSNQHGHPDANVLKRLRENSIDYYSTKQGDLIIESTKDHKSSFSVWNYISGGKTLDGSPLTYTTKKFKKHTVQELAKSLLK